MTRLPIRHQAAGISRAELRLAQRSASDIVERAHREADELRREAREDYETWRAQAKVEAETEVRGELAVAFAQLVARERDARDQLQEELVPLVLRCTEQLLRRAHMTDPSLARDKVREAISRLPSASRVSVRVTPSRVDEVKALAGVEAVLVVEADASLAEGECVVRTGDGEVDGRFSAQMDAVRRALEGA